MKINVKENQLEDIEGLFPEYPYVLHHVELDHALVPWHWHEELEFDYIISGTLKLCTADRTLTFHSGEAFFINSNVLCTMTGEDGCVVDSHLFHSVLLSGHFKSVYETRYVDPVLQNRKIEVVEIKGENKRQKEMISRLKKTALLQKQADTEFQTRNLFSEIWLLLLEEIQSLEPPAAYESAANQERIMTMLSFIRQNYQKKLTLESIARSASVSKRECMRCFQRCIRKTPFEYLLDYRIDKAKKLLRTTDLSIVDSGLRTGFHNGAYFGKVFKRSCGITPGQYRKQYGRGEGPGSI